jgi:transcriptional regulator with XRE-family HTH domain
MPEQPSYLEQSETNFRLNLRHYRESEDLTQADLAERLRKEGLSFHQQTVQKIERGERKVGFVEAVAIAQVLGVDLGMLVDDPTQTTLVELLVHANDAREALRSAIRNFETAQGNLAQYADHLGIEPGSEQDVVSDVIAENAEAVVRDYALRQQYSRQSLEGYVNFMDKHRPGEIGPSEREQLLSHGEDLPGPFFALWKDARAINQEEA